MTTRSAQPPQSHSSWLIYLFLLLILGLAFVVRLLGWPSQDAKAPYLFYEPDEHQHLQIAQLQIEHLSAGTFAPEELKAKPFNALGFGRQLGTLSYFTTPAGEKPEAAHIVKIGRIWSTWNGLFLVVIIFWLGQRLIHPQAGLFAAALVACNDLHITYSHYAVPEVSYTFWLYAFLAAVYFFYSKQGVSALILMALSAAGVLAVKFDFLPGVLGFGGVLVAWHLRWPIRVGYLIAYLFFLGISLWLHHFGQLEGEQLLYSWQELRRQNMDAIPVDQHWVHNPIVYLIGVFSAFGLPSLWSAIGGSVKLWAKRQNVPTPHLYTWGTMIMLLALEFGVRWSIDTPFVRRLNFLMPGLCLLASWQLWYWWQHSRRYWSIFVLLYAVSFMMASQVNRWYDPRYAARDYLQSEFGATAIAYSGYVQTIGMPAQKQKLADSELYVMHETLYNRFGKSFTTPFKLPKCCEEVYHCYWEPSYCEFHQRLLADTDPEFVFHKGFYTREIFPERWLHHALFGHFETFRGDVLIYKRRSN